APDYWTAIPQEIVLDPVNGATIYLLGYYYGFRLYSPLFQKSLDGGATWTGQGCPAGAGISHLAVDPRTPSTLYASGYTQQTYPGQEVFPLFFKSLDGGATWQATSIPDSQHFVSALIADPQRTDVVYAGTAGGGVFKTTNGGETWASMNKGLGNLNILCLAMDPVWTSTIYAGTEGGVFRTTDGGRNWYAINNGLTDLTIKDLAIDPQNTQTIYAATNKGAFSLQLIAPWMFVSRTNLSFAAIPGGVATPPQRILVTQSGSGSLNWTAAKNKSWISADPALGSGSGVFDIGINASGLAPGTYMGAVVVSAPEAVNSPQTITVTLTVFSDGSTALPFGDFATPLDGTSGISGAIPVTGWTLDDLGVDNVKIYRDPVSGEPAPPGGYVFIGDALFVEGARPDVELAYPGYPQNSAAGWGYMLLTNFLPGNGNGTYRLHAFAADREGHGFLLGSKTIACDNAHAVKPFGTIDTPAQGGTASGLDFVNFGWVLTPQPNEVAKDGSTIWVWVDGIKLGHPVYDQYRQDVADNFPGLKNSGGPVGYYHLDTTIFDSGVHTIWWTASDNGGNAEGIGARYFSIVNSGTAAGKRLEESFRAMRGISTSQTAPWPSPADILDIPLSYAPLRVKTGFDLTADPISLAPDDHGIIRIEIREVERLEIDLGKPLSLQGYMIAGGMLRPLPIGSTLNSHAGTFSWLPGPAFVGIYDLVFIKDEAFGVTARIPIRIIIKPKFGIK
ncbi:MAG: hypothetical protein NTU60_02795, partial [Candidatus Aminicenantes bacterium]|nr:hypothetical protein [Candidatus Aminicenantes bacterium]